jgi:hypothetical protein
VTRRTRDNPCHASKDDRQYEIKSDEIDHVVMHEGAVVHKIDEQRAFGRWRRDCRSSDATVEGASGFARALPRRGGRGCAAFSRFATAAQAPLRNAIANRDIAYHWIVTLGGTARVPRCNVAQINQIASAISKLTLRPRARSVEIRGDL